MCLNVLFDSFPGVQPVGESWSEDCVMALQKMVLHRILRVEIQGVHEGKALVALYDESSDPQVNAVEMLNSAGFSVPAPVTTSSEQQVEQKVVTTAAAEPQGGKCEITPNYFWQKSVKT